MPPGESASAAAAQSRLPAFLTKLWKILSDTSLRDIISWNKDGNTFTVKKPAAFAERVLPQYFKHSNFSSFVRQLHIYDFHKTEYGADHFEFRHDKFLRENPELLGQIIRKTAGTGTAAVPPREAVQKTERDMNILLNEVIHLRERQRELEKANARLQLENSVMRDDLEDSRRQQLDMQEKMKRIIIFIKKLTLATGLTIGEGGPPMKRARLTHDGDDVAGGFEASSFPELAALDNAPANIRSDAGPTVEFPVDDDAVTDAALLHESGGLGESGDAVPAAAQSEQQPANVAESKEQDEPASFDRDFQQLRKDQRQAQERLEKLHQQFGRDLGWDPLIDEDVANFFAGVDQEGDGQSVRIEDLDDPNVV